MVRDYLERSFKARINKAQERYMRLMAELGIKPEYKLATDEAKRHLDDLERSKKERLAGLDRLQIARTGPVRHLATAMVLPPDVEIANAMLDGASNRTGNPPQEGIGCRENRGRRFGRRGFPSELIQRVGS